MISLTGVVNFVFFLVIAGLVFWILDWILRYTNPPEPFQRVGRVVLAVAAAFVLIYALLNLGGYAGPLFRP